MIALERVSKHYPVAGARHTVLDDVTVDLTAERGFAILGRNGSGKSTLVRLLSGVEVPDQGRIRRKARVSWPLGLGSAFQPSLTGRDNIRFVARIYACDVDEMVRRTEDFAELGRHLDAPLATYSSGMKARLAFGLSLSIDFDVYLIDEVTEVGDERFRGRSREAFAAKAGRAKVIIVSHSERTIREYCDRAAILEGGKIHAFDSLAEAYAEYRRILTR
jgi:capsular polysaccharide transport system ATP-binding protein